MKKIICLVLIGILLCGFASAEFSVQFQLDSPVEVDLNGDSEIEQIKLQMVGTEEESFLMLVLIGGDGGVNTYQTDIMYNGTGGAMDLDGDGAMEIYLTGDQFFDDYATWCLRYTDEGLKTVPFPYFDRSEITGEPSEYGYGRIVSAENGLLTLKGTQDILGTWQTTRTFALTDGGFEFADGGMFEIQPDPDFAESALLVPVKPINVILDGGEADTLEPGEGFMITKSDLMSVVCFRTEDGKSGRFEITPNAEEGWGFCIDGVSEFEYFEYLPYMD